MIVGWHSKVGECPFFIKCLPVVNIRFNMERLRDLLGFRNFYNAKVHPVGTMASGMGPPHV
jgi:hypothetical protein